MAKRLKIAGGLQTRAAFEPSTFNADKGTVEVTFTTGARGRRSSWMDGPYYEELEVSDDAVDLSRLNNGASVLNAHSSWDVTDVIGVVDRAWIQGKEGRALVRFSDREDVKPIRADVQAGILRHISVGYTVQRLEQVEKVEDVPVYRATKWTPLELSIVPIAFDDGAVVRGRPQPESYEVEVLNAQENRTMPTEPIPAAAPAVPAAAAPAPIPAPAPAVNEAEIRAAAVTAERERATGIRHAVRAANLGDAYADELITNGTALDAARALVLGRLAAAADAQPTRTQQPVQAGEDAREKFVRGAAAWIFQRTGQTSRIREAQKSIFADQFRDVALDGGEFRGTRLSDLARISLEMRGVATKGLYGERLFEVALSRAYNGTGDFPVLLETAMYKTLLAAYAVQALTWRTFCGTKSVQDFRAASFYRNGSFGTLDSVNEHGEYKYKAIPDGEKATVSVSTKGNIIALTRKAMVNDDLGAFTDLAVRFGEMPANSIEDDVYALLLGSALNGLGANAQDGTVLYSTGHKNIGATGAISAATLSSIRQKMGQQKDPSNNKYLSLRPSVLLVPPGIEDSAKTLNGDQFDPSQVGQKTNPVRGLFGNVVSSPRLLANTGDGATRHYGFADPGSYPALVVAFLNGQEAPELLAEPGFETDGMKWRVRLDYGVQVFDHRATVTCIGA